MTKLIPLRARSFAWIVALATCAYWAMDTAWAQQATHPSVLKNPEVNYPMQFDISPPLREMAPVAPPTAAERELPVMYPKLEKLTAQRGQPAVKDGALQPSVLPMVNAAVNLNLLGVGNGFPGYSVPDAPSDVNLAVGDTQVLQWVNVSYAVFDKATGNVIAGPILGNQLWSGFGGYCQSDNSGDIIPQWDKLAHRWVLTQNTFQGAYSTCIAISQTADATGSYYRFAFPQNGFPDYPKWGIMPDAYYQSQNNFGSSGSAYVGVHACAYERAKLLVGDSTAQQICFQTGTFDDSTLPGDLDSAGTQPPSGQPEVFLGSIDNTPPNGSVIYEYLFHVDFTTPSNSTFTGAGGAMPISVASFGLACGGNGACVPQPSPGELLDSLGDRLMYRLAYRNFGTDHQTWLVSHSVTAGSSVGERWYEFRAPENSTSLSVYQQGTFAPDSNYRWMGSIAMDSAQDIALGYSVSSSSVSPSISYTGRTMADALGTMESEASIVSGTGSQISTDNRWGDYTSMALDAADDCTFWYTNQYYMVTASFDWSTRLASFRFNGCGVQAPPFSLSASPSSQTLTQGSSTSYTVTVTPQTGYNGTVNLTVSGCPNNATCTLSPTSSGSPSYPPSTLTVQTNSSTPTGTYGITITGTDSSGQPSNSTTVQLVVSRPDFSLSASPSSQTVVQGSSTSYTVTVAPGTNYSGTVNLTVFGCPNWATCTLSPTSSGPPNYLASTLTVQTASITPATLYTLTITGTDTTGSPVHQTTVLLTVKSAAPPPDFSISAAPSSRTISRGSRATYTVTVGSVNGFSGSVGLSVSGCPSASSCTFSPTSVSPPYPQNSTLNISTNRKSTPTGTYTLTITGSSGGLTHTINVSLTITR
ncbi:MAG TPA: hypothetical protein VMR80_12335 [Candidatus Acidoferrum sp.]|nr:hypothetical protein [Candidatus Acidoferrum sp.]